MQNTTDLFQRADACHRMGKYDEARVLYVQLLEQHPGHPKLLHRLGVIAHQLGDDEEAVLLIEQAIAMNPTVAACHNNLGNALKALDRAKKAEDSYREAIRLQPDYVMAHLNLGYLLKGRGDAEGTMAHCQAVLDAAPQTVEAHCLLGEVLGAQEKFDEAKAAFERAVTIQPVCADAHLGLGHVFRQLHDLNASMTAFQRALRTNQNDVRIYQGLGSLCLALNRLDEAVAYCKKAFELAPEDYAVRHNLGTALRGQGQLAEADFHLTAVLKEQPDSIAALYELVQLRSSMADWHGRDQDVAQMTDVTRAFLDRDENQRVPSLFLQRFDLPSDMWTELMRHQAGVIEKSVAGLTLPCVSAGQDRSPKRLRVGYLSPDLRAHAVGLLVHQMFAHHDRDRFEIFGYTLTNPNDYPDDMYCKAIRDGCDAFVNLSGLSAADAAGRIAEDGIHLLIDLAGDTTFARPEIMALKPAPVQAHYLGFLDTMQADYIPYIIADEIVIPPHLRDRYSEQVVYLPDTFAVAAPFEIADAPVSRSDWGLPEGGMVFACFNHPYKIEPEVFDAWAEILKGVPDSVLWLYRANISEAEDNLKREADERGIAPDRLIFTDSIPIEEHLARMRLADLFLDTFVYNAGTTGVLALWAGLPVLTRLGNRFLNRMGASLAQAAGLPELVCDTTDDYVSRAIELAHDLGALESLRERLWQNRSEEPLFQTAHFVRHLEQAFEKMWAQHVNGQRADIVIERNM